VCRKDKKVDSFSFPQNLTRSVVKVTDKSSIDPNDIQRWRNSMLAEIPVESSG